MATIDPKVLAALKGLVNTPENGDSAGGFAQLSADRNARAIEMQRNLEKAKGDPNFGTGAVPSDVTNITRQIDPFTGALPQEDEQQLAVAQDPRVQAQAAKDLQSKLLMAGAPNAATAQGNVAVEQTKANSAMALQKEKEDALQHVLHPSGTPSTSDQPTPSVQLSGINANGEPTFKVTQAPQQVQAQQHAAQVGLQQYPAIKQNILDATNAGVTGPVMGPFSSWATTSGWSHYLMSPEKEQAQKQLEMNLGMLKKNLAYVHGAARAGASPAVSKYFDSLFNTSMDPASLGGSFKAAEQWMGTYAKATDNFTHPPDPNDPSLDAADTAFGVNGSDLVPFSAGGQ